MRWEMVWLAAVVPGGDRVEQEADGELGHWIVCGRGVRVRRRQSKRARLPDLSRTHQEARTIPGDKFISQASASADVPVP